MCNFLSLIKKIKLKKENMRSLINNKITHEHIILILEDSFTVTDDFKKKKMIEKSQREDGSPGQDSYYCTSCCEFQCNNREKKGSLIK